MGPIAVPLPAGQAALLTTRRVATDVATAPRPTLRLADWHFALDCQPDAFRAAVTSRYADFLTAGPAEPDVVIAAEADQSDVTTDARDLLAAQLTPLEDHYRLDMPGVCGILDMKYRRVALSLKGAVPLEALEYALRITVAISAFYSDGLLLHAAGVLDGGQVRLFIGQSGSGKSTVAAFAGERAVLGDDLILLRPVGGRWHAFGTPFWNPDAAARGGQTASGPVVAIYKLVKDQAVFVSTLPPAAATAELMANCPVVNGRPEWAASLLARCRRLAADVPVQQLHFRRDDSFWAALQ